MPATHTRLAGDARWHPRSTGPPGPVQTAVSLLAHAALPAGHHQVPAVLTRLGMTGDGRPPTRTITAAQEHGLPLPTLRGVFDRLRSAPAKPHHLSR